MPKVGTFNAAASPSKKSDRDASSPEIKWEEDEIHCPICLEHPHNAVLLLCSSKDKGCRPFICDTSYRHSNCLDQFRKSSASLQMSSDDEGERPRGLLCPLCRGTVSGWKVVEPVRKSMNSKTRLCSLDTCGFAGNYDALRKHARAEHPTKRPSVVDPRKLYFWSLEARASSSSDSDDSEWVCPVSIGSTDSEEDRRIADAINVLSSTSSSSSSGGSASLPRGSSWVSHRSAVATLFRSMAADYLREEGSRSDHRRGRESGRRRRRSGSSDRNGPSDHHSEDDGTNRRSRSGNRSRPRSSHRRDDDARARVGTRVGSGSRSNARRHDETGSRSRPGRSRERFTERSGRTNRRDDRSRMRSASRSRFVDRQDLSHRRRTADRRRSRDYSRRP